MVRDFLARYAIPIGATLGVLWAYVRWQNRRHTIIAIETPDPLWTTAVRTARDTLSTMRELYATYGSEMHVKYPLTTASGQVEHVWGRILDLAGDFAKVSLETPTANALVSEPPFKVAIADVEDWQLVLPDGRVRGGFTTQAQITLAERAGRELPPHFQRMRAQFVDRVSGDAKQSGEADRDR